MTVRAAHYAGYSPDRQRPASIGERFRMRRERAALEGRNAVGAYGDSVLSSGSRSVIRDPADGGGNSVPGNR